MSEPVNEITDDLYPAIEHLGVRMFKSSQDEHSEMVAALVKPGSVSLRELTPCDVHLMHMALGIAGESGELVDAIKKTVFYRKPIDRENVIEELGDLEFYMEGLRQALGLTRDDCLTANIAKLGKRYKDFKYSDNAAQVRADKQQGE